MQLLNWEHRASVLDHVVTWKHKVTVVTSAFTWKHEVGVVIREYKVSVVTCGHKISVVRSTWEYKGIVLLRSTRRFSVVAREHTVSVVWKARLA